MKTQLISLIWVIMLCLSCSSPKEEPKPKSLTYFVQARVTGQNLAGVGAAFTLTSQLRASTNNPGPGPRPLPEGYLNEVSKTVDIGEFDNDARIIGKISFTNVTSSPSSYRPSPGSFLKLEMLVNGSVISAALLDENSFICNGCSAPFLAKEVLIETKRL